MLIGGWALPAYGQVRATQDLGITIRADFREVQELYNLMLSSGYQVPAPPDPRAPMFFVLDSENRVEMEIWIRPSGVEFDNELLKRRVRVRPFSDQFEMFAIGPEDFIVNKLARTDRGVQDEQDVISVLRRQREKLHRKYLLRRARNAEVLGLLKELMSQLS
jgi:hypothetical protein